MRAAPTSARRALRLLRRTPPQRSRVACTGGVHEAGSRCDCALVAAAPGAGPWSLLAHDKLGTGTPTDVIWTQEMGRLNQD